MEVTDFWSVGDEDVGHGFAGAIVACGVETRGLCSWVSLHWLGLVVGFGNWKGSVGKCRLKGPLRVNSSRNKEEG